MIGMNCERGFVCLVWCGVYVYVLCDLCVSYLVYKGMSYVNCVCVFVCCVMCATGI